MGRTTESMSDCWSSGISFWSFRIGSAPNQRKKAVRFKRVVNGGGDCGHRHYLWFWPRLRRPSGPDSRRARSCSRFVAPTALKQSRERTAPHSSIMKAR